MNLIGLAWGKGFSVRTFKSEKIFNPINEDCKLVFSLGLLERLCHGAEIIEVFVSCLAGI